MLLCFWLFRASQLDTYDLNNNGVKTQKNIANHGISTKKRKNSVFNEKEFYQTKYKIKFLFGISTKAV